MKLFIQLSFVGTDYSGWQKQKNRITVQEKLTSAAKELFRFDCDVTGCSRTDSGVHANSFCATVTKKGENFIETTIPAEKIPRAFNNFLPNDIAVISAEWVGEDFHARYNVLYKEYVYKIFYRPERDPFLAERCWHIPKCISDTMVEQMNFAAQALVGKHDFSAFMAAGSKIEDATRTVKYVKCIKDGNVVEIRIAADGFLYNMVRIIAGTLVDAAEGKLSYDDIVWIIESRSRKEAGRTAPAHGLYLNKVVYRE